MDERKPLLEPVRWCDTGEYWNAHQGLFNQEKTSYVGAVVGRVKHSKDQSKGPFWWVAAPWHGGHDGEESGYANSLAEAQRAVEAVADKSPTYRTFTWPPTSMPLGLS